jgi:hypothetical protein
MEEIASRDSWTTHPLPDEHAQLTTSWTFTKQQFDQMKRGLIPEQMEDKWFIYYEDGWLHFHRSWTGYCIYQIQFWERDSDFAVAQILVSRDLEQYRESTDEYDLLLLKYLIDRLLLGREVSFPLGDEINDAVTAALKQHHLVGRGQKPAGKSQTSTTDRNRYESN